MGKEIIKIIKIALEALLDIIYPYDNKCIICGVEGFLGICSKCKSEIKRVHQQEEIMAYGYYGGVLKKLILNLKYHKSFIAGKVLADLLCQIIIEKEMSIDFICYVPISKASLKKRGFNQCSKLEKNILELLEYPKEEYIKQYLSTKNSVTMMIEIIKELDKRIMKFKDDHNSYEFSDIAFKAIELVEKNEDVQLQNQCLCKQSVYNHLL